MGKRRYRAFLSYSHRDKEIATWLHRRLETYRFPAGLLGKGESGRLRPIFKDRDELPASDSLSDAIKQALEESDALIVLCSPSAAISPWITKEIDLFKRQHGDRDVFPAVIDGDPPYNIPPPLLVHYEDGEPTEELAEPVAADLRPDGDGRKLGLLKLVAGLAGVELDSLVNREAHRRHRRLAAIAGFSLVGMVVAIGLAVFAIQQRDTARSERAEANGLVEYMLTDLREQLEPVGRLDVLDGVGSRAMDYFARQNIDQLTPSELGRRARAVQLVAEIQTLRGNSEQALPAFREAARTTSELLARDPDDPERMFNHGQSLFWVGYIAWQRGQNDEAKRSLGSYANISTRLAQMDRTNLAWQMEEAYALSNLGTLANEEGRYDEALPLFERSAAIVERVAKAEGRPAARLIELGEGLSWVATTQQFMGDFASSAQTRQAEIELYSEVLEEQPNNFDAMRMSIFAQARMGWTEAVTGKRKLARRHLDAATASAWRLLAQEPDHIWTMEMAEQAFNDRAMLNWRDGRTAAASADFDRAAAILGDLRARDARNRAWNLDKLGAHELARALTDRSAMPGAEMSALAQRWIGRLDSEDSGHVWQIIAAHVLNAVGHARQGNRAAAAQAYARAVAIEDEGVGVNINALALRALAAERLGQGALAAQLRRQLAQYGVDPAIDDRIPVA